MPPDTPDRRDFDVALAEDDFELWSDVGAEADPSSLADLVNRVLDRGVCITGDVTISIAGVDLVYLGLNAVLTSVSTARRIGRAPPATGGGGARPAQG